MFLNVSNKYHFDVVTTFDGEYYLAVHTTINDEKVEATARREEIAIALLFDKLSQELKDSVRK